MMSCTIIYVDITVAMMSQLSLYVKYSTWNNIYIILATILEPKESCRNYVEAGTKWPKCPKLSSKAKNGST